jgi:hypothetical protein
MWKRTKGAEWGTFVYNGLRYTNHHIYSGAISDGSISEVHAGNSKANIITVQGNKRFWYAISDQKDVEIKVIKKKS